MRFLCKSNPQSCRTLATQITKNSSRTIVLRAANVLLTFVKSIQMKIFAKQEPKRKKPQVGKFIAIEEERNV